MMEKEKLLKILILFGGYFELFLGVLFMFMDSFLGLMGLPANYPIFMQILGSMTVCFGLLLIYSARNIETYSIIPKVNCLLRFLVQPFAIISMITGVPQLLPILLVSAIYDVTWAILVLILLKQSGYLLPKKE